jgi:DNA-binding beta-propeller fold protein YncE
MRKSWLACLFAGALAVLPAFAGGGINGPRFLEVQRFATLPDGVRFPEGIAASPSGDIFVGTFDFGPNPNKLVRFDPNGSVSAVKDFGGAPLLGLEFRDGNVYILNFGAGQLQRLPANFDANTPVQVVATFPKIGAPAPRKADNPDGSQDTITFGSNSVAAPNAMVFTNTGDLYISDSFQGAIFKILNATGCSAPCAVQTYSHDPLLATAGFPPFGANGLALSADEKTLFIANTGDNRVLKLDTATTAVSVFAESVHGADGLLFEGGRLWVCANQGDEVLALNAQGRPVIRVGFFAGVRTDGRPAGLLFPASLARTQGFMYVTNLALPLTPAVGDEPEEDVTRWTVSRFRIPH